jgi:hypothetical protein
LREDFGFFNLLKKVVKNELSVQKKRNEALKDNMRNKKNFNLNKTFGSPNLISISPK